MSFKASKVLGNLKFNNGVAKIGDPRANPIVYSCDVYINAQMDSMLFDFLKNNYQSINSLGYKTIRDTSYYYFYRETDLIWVFEPNNNLRYFLKLIEVHGFILYLECSLRFMWYVYLLLMIFGIYQFFKVVV